jgi:hypothetical protein
LDGLAILVTTQVVGWFGEIICPEKHREQITVRFSAIVSPTEGFWPDAAISIERLAQREVAEFGGRFPNRQAQLRLDQPIFPEMLKTVFSWGRFWNVGCFSVP